MQFSLRAFGSLTLVAITAFASPACNTLGVTEVFMSPDSDENGRRWTEFTPASDAINCIARIATGRKDITMQGRIYQTGTIDASGTVTPIAPVVRSTLEFHPTAGTSLSTLTVVLTATNPETGEKVAYPRGVYSCQVFADDGENDRTMRGPIKTADFTIQYAACPETGVTTGEICEDVYGAGKTAQCGVNGQGTPNCTCTGKKGWLCPAGSTQFGGVVTQKVPSTADAGADGGT